ncbi:hypothetical protein HBH44_101550 [Parastagonospora nodorum]|nr:hypothetical protein HBH54_134210 [Parastagonospora nodorum]KAH4160829.1 hypothetical protein HBH44_101550 [Parastagonospora nodorum]KAH4631201.1 hypothetical protein HBH55_093760 [Parastagonospora nodorum]KAH4639928.1 hypothetical protein HBH81_096950 [Parastagonospora nodorum]KAH5003719.1 hypothetical protein HBI74_231260 [Parastagonospora nodorum]
MSRFFCYQQMYVSYLPLLTALCHLQTTTLDLFTPQKGHQIASFTLHDDFDITIIWHNVDTRSHFTRFSIESCGRIERILIDFARVLQTVVLE